ncbi:MAG: electron transfer flavoprotein subunit alpha/FixB family protein [Thermoplasmata archaeon]
MINSWVYIEGEGSSIEDVSLEIIGRLNELKNDIDLKITGFYLGTNPGDLPRIAISYGVDHFIFLKSDLFSFYDSQAFVNGISDLVRERNPDIMLFGATYQGRDFAGRLAARLKTGLAANAISLKIDKNGLLYTGVPGYGGRFIAEIVNMKARPQISTVRQGIFKKMEMDESRSGEIEIVDVDLKGFNQKLRLLERKKLDIKDITKSERVVIIGNGAGNNLKPIEEFAKLIGADIGVTRPVADRGLAPRDIQVGSTGVSLNSKIAIIFGSSGSNHFVSGIERCKFVISVDIDKNSNIFNYSDYCVVADMFKLLPFLIRRMGGDL